MDSFVAVKQSHSHTTPRESQPMEAGAGLDATSKVATPIEECCGCSPFKSPAIEVPREPGEQQQAIDREVLHLLTPTLQAMIEKAVVNGLQDLHQEVQAQAA